MSTIPDKGQSLHPAMDNMTVTDNGVCKLLRNLNIQKASGPAEIPTRLTKEHAENLAQNVWNSMDYSLMLNTESVKIDHASLS